MEHLARNEFAGNAMEFSVENVYGGFMMITIVFFEQKNIVSRAISVIRSNRIRL